MNNLTKAIFTLMVSVNTQLFIRHILKKDPSILETSGLMLGVSVVTGLLYGVLSYLTSYSNYLREEEDDLKISPITTIGAGIVLMQNLSLALSICDQMPTFFAKTVVIIGGLLTSFCVSSTVYCIVLQKLFAASKLKFHVKGKIEEQIIDIFKWPVVATLTSGFLVGAFAISVSQPAHFILGSYCVVLGITFIACAPLIVLAFIVKEHRTPPLNTLKFGKHELYAAIIVAGFLFGVVATLDTSSQIEVITRSGVVAMLMISVTLHKLNFNRAVRNTVKQVGGLVLESKD